jgi:hypothetical protein
MLRVILVVIAIVIVLYLLGWLKYLHVHVSGVIHIPNIHTILIVALIAIILALALRR